MPDPTRTGAPPEKRPHREHKEDRDQLSIRTLLLANGQEMSLYHNEAMDPVEEAWEKAEFSPVIQAFLRERQDAMKNFWTLKVTYDSPEWKQQTWEFLQDYLEQEGSDIVKGLEIENTRRLSPSQAIRLTTKIVARLMRYDYVSLETEENKTGNTREDNLSALELLQEGRSMKSNADWEGNGVCRNYAAVESTVFESPKGQQEPGSHLEQMEVVVVVGTEHLPKSIEKVVTENETHAWNVFLLTPQQGEVHLSIIDPTWTATEESHRDDPGRKTDYTFERMEGVIYSLGKAISETEPESWGAITGFYGSMIDTFDHRPDPQAQEQRDYYTYRFLELIESIPKEQQKRDEIEKTLQDIENRYIRLLQDPRTNLAINTGTRLRVLAHRRPDEELKQQLKKYVQTRIKT